jgi:glucokinase
VSSGTGPGSGDRPGVAFGIDIGGTKVLGVALDANDAVVAESRVPTPSDASDPTGPRPERAGAEVARAVADVVAALGDALGTPTRARTDSDPGTGSQGRDDRSAAPAIPVGVGAPGMLDREGVLRFAPNLPGAAGAHVKDLVEARLPGTPVVVENDANCAAYAEHRHGAARGASDAVIVTLGTGIGGGVIRAGEVLVGAYGFAGEIGHMVVDPSGPLCPCGRRGCWERYASGAGLGHLAREAAFAGRLHNVVSLAGGTPELVRGEHVTAAARDGDPGALGVMDDLGWWVALGLTNLTALYDPERIVIGGGLAASGDVLLAPAREAYGRLVEGSAVRPAVPIVAARWGERAGAVGAAMAVRAGGFR